MENIFNPEVYMVTRDEFKGFIDELKPECIEYKVYQNEDMKVIRIFAKDDYERCFAEQVIKPEEIIYFIYELPKDEERNAPKPIRKVVLETKEEVQRFFEILAQIQKGEQPNDGTIS